MRLQQLYGVTFVGGIVLAAAAANIPHWTRASAVSPQTTALNAGDQDKKDADKKEEEPKGDPIDVDKLPKAVVEAVKKDMPGARITKAAKLEDGSFFLDDVKVGKNLWDVTVSPKGKIIKKVEMKD